MIDPQMLTRIACCGLQAAEAVLEHYAIPLPKDRRIVAWIPDQVCGCDGLYVRQIDSVNTRFDDDHCGPPRHELTFEVHISRCVTVPDPQKGCEHPPGECSEVLQCEPGETILPEECDGPLGSSLAEADLIMQDRWVLEAALAEEWRCCLNGTGELCEESPCGPLALDCRYLRWDRTTPLDSGGCAGSILTFTMKWPA